MVKERVPLLSYLTAFGLMTDVCDRVVLLDRGKSLLKETRKHRSKRITIWRNECNANACNAMTARERQLSDELNRIRSTYSFRTDFC